MTDLRKVSFRVPHGTMSWDAFEPWFGAVLREILAKTDARNPQSDFAGAFLVATDGSATIGEVAKVASQKTLPTVNCGNRLSAQNINPLSSTGSPSTAQIAIASHTVQYGFGVVPYNSGTITGLDPLTTYFVYTSDPDFTGGAVTYTATESPPDVVSDNDYYYVGSITTANSTPTGNVTAASSTSPIVIRTTAAHGFTAGNSVTFSAMPGDFAVLNGNTYTITYIDADEFSVAVDGALFAAYSSGGTVTRVSVGTSGGGSGAGWNWNIEIP